MLILKLHLEWRNSGIIGHISHFCCRSWDRVVHPGTNNKKALWLLAHGIYLSAAMDDTTAQNETIEELRAKLIGLGPCDHEAGICTGACDLIDKINKLKDDDIRS
jgi:hypothetical protein